MSTTMSVTKTYTNRLKSDVKCMLENFEGELINIPTYVKNILYIKTFKFCKLYLS